MDLAADQVILSLYGDCALPEAIAALLPAQPCQTLPDFPKLVLSKQIWCFRRGAGWGSIAGHLDGVAAVKQLLTPFVRDGAGSIALPMQRVVLTVNADLRQPFQAMTRLMTRLSAPRLAAAMLRSRR